MEPQLKRYGWIIRVWLHCASQLTDKLAHGYKTFDNPPSSLIGTVRSRSGGMAGHQQVGSDAPRDWKPFSQT